MKHKDRLDLPKGHLDAGETTMQAALRELEEETGICEADIVVEQNFEFRHEYDVSTKKGKRRKRLTIFLAYLQNEVDILPTEHIGYQWEHWQPGLRLQKQTLDPLLEEVDSFFANGIPTALS